MENNKRTLKVTQEWVNRIEALQYETNARRELVAYMIGNSYDTESDSYIKYHTEYMDFFKKLEEAKEEFAREYVYPEANGKQIPWNLDFKTGTVTF